jgi:glutathione S-transferase
MIELYSWPTPNGHKIHIMLEETGLAYRVHGVDIGRGDQFDPAFLAISPNNKVPAIVDSEGPAGEAFSLFESGAILLYLAEKAGMFLPADARARYDVIQWLMFQMGAIGPLLGQAHHFRAYAPERIPMPSTATPGRRPASMAFSIDASLTDPSSPAIIRSPIWPFTPGFAIGSDRGSTSPAIPI